MENKIKFKGSNSKKNHGMDSTNYVFLGNSQFCRTYSQEIMKNIERFFLYFLCFFIFSEKPKNFVVIILGNFIILILLRTYSLQKAMLLVMLPTGLSHNGMYSWSNNDRLILITLHAAICFHLLSCSATTQWLRQ